MTTQTKEMPVMATRKPKLVFSSESFRVTVRMLRLAICAPTEAFGKRPSYAPDLRHYSEAVDAYLGVMDAKKVSAAKALVLLDGHSFDFKRDDEIAAYRLAVAEMLIG